MRQLLLGTSIATTLLIACSSNKSTSNRAPQNAPIEKSTTQITDVPYREAKNYFAKNNNEGKIPEIITTQQEFDKYFGPAATMGEKGAPTPIDFSKEFLIVIDAAATNKETEIKPTSLSTNSDGLVLNYSFKQRNTIGFTLHPFLLLIVENSHRANGKVKLNRTTE